MKTVNFIEAVNSGKRFGFVDRPKWHIDCDYEEYEYCEYLFAHLIDHCGDAQAEIVNGVYKLEEKSITITESDLENALIRVRREYEDVFAINQKALMTELGF